MSEMKEGYLDRMRRLAKEDRSRVNTLREALARWKRKRPGSLKIDDIQFEGARIGTLYSWQGVEKLPKRYLVMFKREFYHSFSRHFPEVPDKGFGIVTAKKIVGWAADQDIIIASVFPDGRCYSVHAYDYWLYYEQYKTDVAHLPGEIAYPLELANRDF